MSFGKMNSLITIMSKTPSKDEDGFVSVEEQEVIRLKAYKDEQHASLKWVNMATFTSANATFTFRKVPTIDITSGMIIVCEDHRYKIVSVEPIRKMYLEAKAEKIEPMNG